MKIRLEKKNRVTTDFIELEVENYLLKSKSGKIGKKTTSNSTKHCGTNEKATAELNRLKEEYLKNKYYEVSVVYKPKGFEGVYDKAKWHFRGDFPKELNDFQGYVHTGIYISWLIEKGFFNYENDNPLKEQIEKVKERKITGAKFFEQNLDGVLLDEDLTEIGNEFTYEYYEKGKYLDDYCDCLCEDLPSLYHVKDNWENFEIIKPILEKRFHKWEKSEKSPWLEE